MAQEPVIKSLQIHTHKAIKHSHQIKSVLWQENESNFEVTLDRPVAAADNLPSN